MPEDRRTQPLVDVVEVGVVATGAVVGGAAGAGLGVAAVLVNKLGSALTAWRLSKQSRFLERVCHYLDEDDPEAAAAFVLRNAETDQFVDTLERGYEAMRRAFDPLAAECLCLLTADHARSGRPTDRRFTRAAALLEQCDRPLLSTLNSVAQAYSDAIAGAATPDRGRTLFSSRGDPEANRGPFFFVVAYDQPNPIRSSHDVPAPSNLDRALAQMAQNGLGLTWTGLGASPPEERRAGNPNSEHHFHTSDDDRMRDLYRYLAPARREPSDGST
jgi:hypothetical protein